MAKKGKVYKTLEIEEYPYSVPSNWSWCSYDVVSDVRDGTHDSPQYVNEGYPLVTSKNLKNGELRFEKISYISDEDHQKISMRSKVDEGDILFAMIGTIGNPVLIEKIIDEFSIKNVALFKPNSELVRSKYLKYLLLEKSNMDRLLVKAKGSTQKFIALGKLRSHMVPIAPLPEQQRIVNRIESLFEKIDKAEALINEAREGFEKRKEAILAAAFRGELTEKWRAEHGVSRNTWEYKEIEALGKLISGQHIMNKDYNDQGRGIGYLTGPSDFNDMYPSISKWTDNPKVVAVKDDILITVKGSGVGKVNILNESNAAISRQLMAIRPGKCNYLYVYYYMSTKYGEMQQNATGTAIPGLSRKDILSVLVPIPSIEEQEQVVKIIVELLSYEKDLDDKTCLNEEMSLLKKSILAKAFRGELGTNEADESPIELVNE